jgi:hypothetical protein
MKNNILNKTKVYLVGGMQYTEGRGWREELTPKLKGLGVTVFDPYIKPFIDDCNEDESVRANLKELMKNGDYDAVAKRMKTVRNFDLRLCDLSDFIIAHINPSVASWGSAEEIVTCVRAKKPVFLSIEGTKKACPLWIMGMLPHKYIYNNLDEVFATLQRIDSGEKKIDSDRWKLLQESYR